MATQQINHITGDVIAINVLTFAAHLLCRITLASSMYAPKPTHFSVTLSVLLRLEHDTSATCGGFTSYVPLVSSFGEGTVASKNTGLDSWRSCIDTTLL